MKSNLLQSYKTWKRSRKISRETPEIWFFESAGFGYIQIPKVATRSIQQCLANHYVELEGIDKPLNWDKESVREIEQKTAFHASQKRLKEISNDYFIFSFVRNPYSRIYSAYKNKVLQPLEGEKNIFKNHGVELGIKFNEFVDIIVEIPDHKIDRHLRSQSWFLTFEETLIPTYVGHLESFESDWASLVGKFALPLPEHRNSTEGAKDDGFDEKVRVKIWQRYQKDFIMFGYDKGF